MKTRFFRSATGAMAVALSLIGGHATAQAQAWPAKPVRVIVPFAPGGTADTLGRLVSQKLGETFNQTFLVENRPGAGGLVGSEMVAKSRPDGYTLLVSGVASHAIAPTLSKKAGFDPIKDFTHIALFGGPPSVLAVHPSVPARTFSEFKTLAKAQPGKFSYGSPGNGTQGHLVAENMKQVLGIEMAHVPYKGAGPAVGDLVAGHIEVGSTTLSTTAGQLKAGKIRALAVSSTARVPDFPDVPTFAELGHPELNAVIWFSLSGPPGMPPDIVQRMNAEVRRIMRMPEVREKLRPEGIELNDLDPTAFTAFVVSELKRWAPVVRASGASVD